MFSGLNNLINISLDARYGTVCGYTEAEVDTVFAPELPGLSLKKVENTMPGYCFYTIGYANQAVRACLNAAFLASLPSPKR